MTLKEALAELERAGTAQNRKVYARHGVGSPMFGVSYADQAKLQKRLGVNHELALALWATGNHDARVLATKIADPARLSSRDLDRMAKDLDSYVLADAFALLVERTPLARKTMEAWAGARSEWVGRAAWQLAARLAMRDPDLDDDTLANMLVTIEREIHARKNRTRDAMNSALIAIGLRSPALRKAALAAAARIGPVEVDHGETGCTTPDAAAYIRRAASRPKRTGRARRGA